MSDSAPVPKLPLVAVVSVTYNRIDPLLVLLEQLQALDYDAARLDVFLVDNASTDGTVDQVRRLFPHVKLIENSENSGVSAGFNRSIEAALNAPRDYDYLWLLDSDAEVEPRTLKSMLLPMQRDPGIGVTGSAVYDPLAREKLVTAGLRVDWARGDIPLLLPEPDNGDALLDVDLIPACSMLTRASIYADVGPWDNRFPLYWGDTDWCARVLAHGHRVCCAPDSRVWHRDWSAVARGFGAGNFIRDHLRGGLLFFLRHDPDGARGGARNLMLKIHLRAALEHLTLRDGFAQAYIEAARQLLDGRFDRSFSQPPPGTPPRPLEELVDELAASLPARPRILLNQLADPAQTEHLRATLERHLEHIEWLEIAPQDPANEVWQEYRVFDLPQLWRHLRRRLGGLPMADLSVSDVSRPLIYNFAAGKRALLLDGSGRAVVNDGGMLRSLFRMTRTVLAGAARAYLQLPDAFKSCEPLREAVAAPDLPAVARRHNSHV